MQQKYIVSVDWFQISCKRQPYVQLAEGQRPQGTLRNDAGKFNIYELATSGEFNPIFSYALEVRLHKFPVCIIYYTPRVSTIRPEMCSIKMSNAILYSGRWVWYLRDVMGALGWQFNNITRVDVCADFNTFAKGLKPQEFINRYLRTGVADETRPTYHRCGSNTYTMIATREISQRDVGGWFEPFSQNVGEYLRWGTRNSGVCTYLYNKSKELAEVKNKGYIRDLWKKGGLLDDEENPVFRVEFSISAKSTRTKRDHIPDSKEERLMASGMWKTAVKRFDVVKLSVDDFGAQGFIENLFFGYATKYFQFRQVGHQKYAKDWPLVHLFDSIPYPTVKPYNVTNVKTSGIAERNAARCIERVVSTRDDVSIVERLGAEQIIGMLDRIYHVRSKEIQRTDLEKIIDLLGERFSWDEISTMNIVSVGQLAEVKKIIEQLIYYRIGDLYTDPRIREAIDEHDATQQLMKEEEINRFYLYESIY